MLLEVIAKFADVSSRKLVAKELAGLLGAEDLIIFVHDPEIDILLPALGFQQTLQNPGDWQDILVRGRINVSRGTVSYPDIQCIQQVYAIPIGNGVAVLIGGNPAEKDIKVIKQIGPFLLCHFEKELEIHFIKSNERLAIKETQKAERIAKALESIRHKLNVSYVELSKKNEELTLMNNDLDNFIYTASHDLKAPVSNIEGLINTLSDIIKQKDFTPEDIEPIIEMTKASINRFSSTIKDLTTITKVQKETEAEGESINVKDIIGDIQIELSTLIINSKAKISVDCEACPQIKFSRKNIKSVLLNLITNGIKYKSLERDPEIHISTEVKGDFTVLKITDNGLGLEEEKLKKLFSMFKRFHDHVEGTGIGLYLVKRIVTNAGGKMEVDSVVGKGTTFKIYFRLV